MVGRVILVMGVSGAGKSTVAGELAAHLGAAFVEADELHPPENVASMEAGVPLTDEMRWGWLDAVAARAQGLRGAGDVVVACSALKRVYRDRLRAVLGADMAIVCLIGSHALLTERMGHRTGHFMPVTLLDSQLSTLEVPSGEGEIVLDVAEPPEALIERALGHLRQAGPRR
jgi:gluconokinase